MSATTTRVIDSSPETIQWGYLDGRSEASVRVEQDEAFEVRSLTCNPLAESREELAPGLAQLQSTVGLGEPSPGPHVLVGPIDLVGHLRGWALQVDVDAIWPSVPAGWNAVKGGRGLSPDRAGDADVEVLRTDGTTVHVSSGIRLPFRPFFGVVGVRPDPSLGRLSTIPPGPFGGNIDCREFVAGTRLVLPTFTDGAGFLIGDGHGCQGDGEISETAMETSMDGIVRLRSLRDIVIERPVGVTPDAVVFLGFGDTFDQAATDAVAQTLRALETWAGLSVVDACRLLSLGCDVRVTQLVNGTLGAHVMVPTQVVDQFGPTWPECFRPESLTGGTKPT